MTQTALQILSKQQVQDLSNDLAEKVLEPEQLKKNKAVAMKDYTDTIKDLQISIRDLAATIVEQRGNGGKEII